jgi:polysaccharide deacetylase 2 family uncharacterized protein YibQ
MLEQETYLIDFDAPIRQPDEPVSSPARLKAEEKYRAKQSAERAEKRANDPNFKPRGLNLNPENINRKGRPKSIVNKVTEYGSLFNKMNQDRIDAGLPPLKTAMETLIEALQSDELSVMDKVKIADRIAGYESSRAPVITLEHQQRVTEVEDSGSADDKMKKFLESLERNL